MYRYAVVRWRSTNTCAIAWVYYEDGGGEPIVTYGSYSQSWRTNAVKLAAGRTIGYLMVGLDDFQADIGGEYLAQFDFIMLETCRKHETLNRFFANMIHRIFKMKKNTTCSIDVCLVTRDRATSEWLSKLSYVPLNNLIVETSKPLALARMRAIQKVETEWFAFVDDDIEIGSSWFSSLFRCIKQDVGAIQGILSAKGLGEKWDQAVNKQIPRRSGELKRGERGFTHNTLIRTELAEDWRPSRNDLSAWEDYEITQHILRKGYRWLVVPVEAYHRVSWGKVKLNAIWSMHGWKKLNPSRLVIAEKILEIIIHNLINTVTIPVNWRYKIYHIRQNAASILGLLT